MKKEFNNRPKTPLSAKNSDSTQESNRLKEFDLSDYEGLFLKANIPTIHVKEFIRLLEQSIITDDRDVILKKLDKLVGEELTK